MMNSHMGGVSPADAVKILSEMTVDDVNRYICEEIDITRSALSIIKNPAYDQQNGGTEA